MGNILNNNGLMRDKNYEQVKASIKEELRLSRLAIVTKSFSELHITGFKTDPAAIFGGMNGGMNAAKKIVEQAELAPEPVVQAIEAAPADVITDHDEFLRKATEAVDLAARSKDEYESAA